MGKRKRIAIFANGWNNEYLQEFGQGAFQCAKVTDTDLFVFTNYSTHGLNEVDNSGEFNIYLLPDLNDFDGAMFLTNSFNLDSELQYLQEQISGCFYYCRIKDKTHLKISYDQYRLDKSLKGEFIRLMEQAKVKDEDRDMIIRMGLKALAGEEPFA